MEIELLHLSLVAFTMFNRGQQWAAAAEIQADLAVLLGEELPSGLKSPLSRSETVLGRFFFIHQAQAMRSGRSLTTYEFLHATFGEYLVARLTHRLVRDLAAQEAVAASTVLGSGACQDGLLYALLSFAPLTSRGPVLAFLGGLTVKMPPDELSMVRKIPITLFRRLSHRVDDRYRKYQPCDGLSAVDRFARYGLNLMLLATVFAGHVRASELLPPVSDKIDGWRKYALLWQATLTSDEWTGLLSALEVSRVQTDGNDDVSLALNGQTEGPPEDVDKSRKVNHDTQDIFGLQATFTCDNYAILTLGRLESHARQTRRYRSFVYDALDTIATLVRADSEGARELLFEFAAFTKHSIHGLGGFTTLAEELRNVDSYLTLERARLGDRLQVRVCWSRPRYCP